METGTRENELKKLASALCTKPGGSARDLAAGGRDQQSDILQGVFIQRPFRRNPDGKGRRGRRRPFCHYGEGYHEPQCAFGNDALVLRQPRVPDVPLPLGSSWRQRVDTCRCSYDDRMRAFFPEGPAARRIPRRVPAAVMAEIFGGEMAALFEAESRGRIASAMMADYWETIFLFGVEGKGKKESHE